MLFLPSCDKSRPADSSGQEETTYVSTDSGDRPVEFNATNGGNFIQYYNNYVYFNKLNSPLMRYNPATDIVTYVCGDPLCRHNSPDCPLYGLKTPFYIFDNKIFFKKIYSYGHYKAGGGVEYIEKFLGFCSYDLLNSKITVYEQTDNPTNADFSIIGKVYELYTGRYRFYYDYMYNSKLEKYVYAICRMDLNTKENIVFESESNTSSNLSVSFLFSIGERIYFSDLKSIYSTDYDLKDKKIVAEGKFPNRMFTDGSLIFWKEVNGDNRNTLYSMSVDGGEINDLQIEARSWELTSDYIYYVTNDSITVGKLSSSSIASDKLILNGSELHRCRHDGSGDELVWKAEGDNKYTRFNEWLVVGNNIYATYTKWTDTDGDGIFTDSDCYQSNNNFNIMRVSIPSGDVKYLYPPN
jgi:hypothetical protein